MSGPVTEFRFERPPFLTPPLAAMLAAAPIGFLVPWLRDVAAGAPPGPGLALAAVLFGAFAAVVCGIRALVRPRLGAVIELHDAHAVLPISSRSRRVRSVPYGDVTSLNLLGSGRWTRLLVASSGRNFVYPAKHLEGGAHRVEELRASLRAKIAALPDGAERLRALDERDARGTRIMQSVPRVSVAIIGLLAVIYTWTRFTGALDDPFGLVAYGANVPVLVEAGEWYRLFSANFLHINLLHLYLNGLGILILGMLLERLIGAWRFLALYLVAAVAGAAASAYASGAALSVGASTAVFGLLGALGLVNWRFRDRLPGGFRQPLRWWVLILGINALLPVLVPMIDWAAHAGGFVAGFAFAAVVCRDARSIEPPHDVGAGFKVVTAALVLVSAFALAEGLGAGGGDGAAAESRVARELVARPGVPARTLNTLAWRYATSPDASSAELALAERAAARAVEAQPGNASFLDTLATVYYRQRDLDRAVTTQQRAVELDERRVLVSQMGRFLQARIDSAGPFTAAGADASAIRVTPDAMPSSFEILIELPHDVDAGLELFVLVERGPRLIGTLRVVAGSGLESGGHRIVLEPDRFGELLEAEPPQRMRLRLAYADASACACTPGQLRARYFPMDPEVRSLP